MSQQIVYKCNACGKIIGEKTHLSISFQGGSITGTAYPPTHPDVDLEKWYVKSFDERWVHFHNGTCAGKWFDKQLNRKPN